MTDRPTHSFPKWGPRGPFRVYSWTQTAVSGFGVLVAAVLLVVGFVPQATVLLALVGALGLKTGADLPLWTQVGAGWAHLVNNLGSEPHDRGSSLEVGAYRVGEREMGLVRDGRRVVAAMRLSPRFNHWLASNDELEVYSDDWMRVLSSIPSTVDRIQILTLLQPTRASGHRSDVLGAAKAAIASRSRQITTYLIVRLKEPIEDDETAGRIAHETLQHLGGQLPQELVAAEILSPLDWNTLLANCSATELPNRVRWDHVEVDEHLESALWVWDWPHRPTLTGFLSPLLTLDVESRISLTIEPLDPEPRQRVLDYAYRRAESALATATGAKHRKRAELETLDRQLTELNAGHIPARALLTISVSAATRVSVDEAVRAVKSKATACHSRVDIAGGHQAAFLDSSLPLCRGVDRSPL